MSIHSIGSYLPTALLRAASPIAADGLVSLVVRSPKASLIAGLGTLILATRNVSTLEKVAVTLIYVAYRFFYNRYLQQQRRSEPPRTWEMRGIGRTPLNMRLVAEATERLAPPVPLTPLKILEKQFGKVIDNLTFLVDLKDIKPSTVHRIYFKKDREALEDIRKMFQLANTDMDNLYNQLLKETECLPENERYQAIANLLTDKTKPFYARFCDPSKPTLLFFYPLVRGCVYYTRQSNNTRQSHPFALSDAEKMPFFGDTEQSQWRLMYNNMLNKWAQVIDKLPPDAEIRERAVKDENPSPFPDDAPGLLFKILQPKLLLGL